MACVREYVSACVCLCVRVLVMYVGTCAGLLCVVYEVILLVRWARKVTIQSQISLAMETDHFGRNFRSRPVLAYSRICFRLGNGDSAALFT